MPKHFITDQGSVFTSVAFREFIDSNRVKIRYGNYMMSIIPAKTH